MPHIIKEKIEAKLTKGLQILHENAFVYSFNWDRLSTIYVSPTCDFYYTLILKNNRFNTDNETRTTAHFNAKDRFDKSIKMLIQHCNMCI